MLSAMGVKVFIDFYDLNVSLLLDIYLIARGRDLGGGGLQNTTTKTQRLRKNVITLSSGIQLNQ